MLLYIDKYFKILKKTRKIIITLKKISFVTSILAYYEKEKLKDKLIYQIVIKKMINIS